MSSDILANLNSPKPIDHGSDVNSNVMEPRGIASVEETELESGTQDNASSSQEQNLHEVIQDVENYVQNIRKHLSFSVDEDIGKTVIKVVDSETDELIRQIPSEEFLEIAKALEKTKSILMKTEA
jgi:flagellar protein FlaG